MSRLPALNAEQAAVVRRLDGDVAVAAGAGSGKTRVLAERFAERVLVDEAADPAASDLSHVLLITFTDKAAGELSERVRRVFLDRERTDLARAVDRAWISTIHGFCQRIVRRHALDLGMDPGFAVLADPEVGVVRHEAFDEAVLDERLSDDRVWRLLREHGLEAVRSAVVDGLDRVREMGRTVDDLTLPERPDVRSAVVATTAEIARVLDAYSGLKRTPTVGSNAAAMRGLVDALQGLPQSGGEGIAADVLRVTSDFKVSARGGDEMTELTRDARDTVAELRNSAAGDIACDDAEGLAALLRAYDETYARIKKERNVLDFEDLQLTTAALFEQQPRIAERYARQFSTIMVDEFQDTNALQMRVVMPIAHGKLCIVGDECQSIYGFRHADVQVFRDVRDAVAARDSEAYQQLATNYRTHSGLLSTVNRVFAHPTMFGDAFLRLRPGSARDTGVTWPEAASRTEVILVDSAGWDAMSWREAEAAAVALRIRRLVDDSVASPGDVVVLLRAMTNARTYIRALESQRLGVYTESGGGFFGSSEVGDLRAMLRVIADPTDGEAVVALLAGGLGAVSDDGLYRLAGRAGSRGDLWAAVGSAKEAGLEGDDLQRARLVRETVDDLRKALGRRTLTDTILGGVATLAPGGGCFSRDAAWANARKIARLAAAYEQIVPADAGAFLSYLDDREAFVKRERGAGLSVEGGEAVRVMSVHAAKGLEFPVVVVADLGNRGHVDTDRLLVFGADGDPSIAVKPSADWGDGLVPTAYASAVELRNSQDTAEAKRVFYVACTRAEQALILAGSCDLSRPAGGSLAIDWVRTTLLAADDGRAATAVAADTIGPEREQELLAAVETHVSHAAAARPKPVPLPELSTGERAQALGPLSHTKLEAFATCPYRFFAESVLGIRDIPATAMGEVDPTVFGSAVHAALQTLCEEGAPTELRLNAIGSAYGLGDKGMERLRYSLDAYQGSSVAARAKKVGVRPEVAFAVPVGEKLFVGSMDLYALRDGAALIVDYKTGAAASERGPRERFAHQAERYAFAAFEGGAASVEVVFVEVEHDARETSFAFHGPDRKRLRDDLERSFAEIAQSAFEPLAHYEERSCLRCPARAAFCPVQGPED